MMWEKEINKVAVVSRKKKKYFKKFSFFTKHFIKNFSILQRKRY